MDVHWGTSFRTVVDMNCIPSTNSAHRSRKLSTNMLTLHSSAYATPVVVQWNYNIPRRSLHKPHTGIVPKPFIPKAVWLRETSHHVTWSDSHTEAWCDQSVSQLTPVSGVTDTQFVTVHHLAYVSTQQTHSCLLCNIKWL